MSKHSIDHFTKFGSLYVVFFFLQAFGYAHGIGATGPTSVYEAVTFGMSHLLLILRPHDGSAWPLSPFTCGLLLMVVPYVPALLRMNKLKADMLIRAITAWLVSTALIAGYAVIDASDGQPDPRSAWWAPSHPLAFTMVYLLAALFWAFLAWQLLGWVMRQKQFKACRRQPNSDWIAMGMIGLIMFLAYIGGKYDGAIDKKYKTPAYVELGGLLNKAPVGDNPPRSNPDPR